MRTLIILPITILMLFNSQISMADPFNGKPVAGAAAGTKQMKSTPLTRSGLGAEEEQQWYHPFEIGELKIRQSNDGTGIIKEVTCADCEFQFVKITPDTEVFVNGNRVELLRARERAGQQAYIKFDKETAEVKRIYWAE